MIDSLKKQLFHLFKLIEFTVAKTWGAISFITIDAEIAIFICSNNSFASETFASTVFCILGNHAFLVLVCVTSVFFNALVFGA
tara:strand:- start:1087 stop:1335 length:249 start_codon:yes stop_codon:yes gene_type:complete